MAGFFTLQPGSADNKWLLEVAPWLSVGAPDIAFMFGGVGLGATVEAAERTTGRPVAWATTQYLAYAPRGSTVEFEVTPLVEGHHTSQARATAWADGRQVLGAGVSLGTRPGAVRRQFVTPPQVPRPQDCPRLPIRWGFAPDDMYSRVDVRIAKGWDATGDDAGHMIYWMRPTGEPGAGGGPIDRQMLAIMADFVPASIGNALSDDRGDVAANSLDNCIRFLGPVETEWVLCDSRVHGAADGFGHGQMLLFAEDGTLMATASQSVVLRSTRFGHAG
ncbi:Acyl-CoA thioesterase [Sphingomonas laterariae]|uniref:Acyl-CoA thioesterase n=1 Tax=Edaphosphingomonas laterariae TaxID=861865 RepID=A0A239D5F0_9SPHN|nr:thioesterase family protein [Sphingomonas laterariae]SNS27645.1 Acyl-CoA thioesterase [Sphingomonas laterariae]